MDNYKYNFLNVEGHRVPLLTTANSMTFSKIDSPSGYLEYVASTIAPWDFTIEDKGVLGDTANSNWGKFDQPGIKRMHNSVENPEANLDVTEESGIYLRNHIPQGFSIFGYFGNNFNSATAVEPSSENPNEGVGYWMEVAELQPYFPANAFGNPDEIFSEQFIPWYKDEYGNQMERLYLYVTQEGQHFAGLTQAEKDAITQNAIDQVKDAYGYDYNLYVARQDGDTAIQIDFGVLYTNMEADTLQINDNRQYGMTYLQSQPIFQVDGAHLFEENIAEEMGQTPAQFTEMIYAPNAWNGQYTSTFFGALGTKAFMVIEATNTQKYVISPTSITNYDEAGVEGDMVDINFTFPSFFNTNNDYITKFTVYLENIPAGVVSGAVEGSFLSGATVTAKDINGNEMTAITNSNGYYEFPQAAYGEIKAVGGINEMTGENYDAQFDEAGDNKNDLICTGQEMVTDSNMGGIISPISTLAIELRKNEGLSEDEAIEVLANEGPELFNLPSSLGTNAKLREYLQLGLNGIQAGGAGSEDEYTGFLMFSKNIAEQQQTFLDSNINQGFVPVGRRRSAAAQYNQSLTRFLRRKREGEVNTFQSDYLAKAGSDADASAINTSSPSKKDQFYLILADASEKLDSYLRENEKLAGSKAELKAKAKAMMEEMIDDQESISTSGKSYEDIAVEINEKFAKRKLAAREEQYNRYQGTTTSFSAKKSAQTFAITKEVDGYKRTGKIIRKTGDSAVDLTNTAKTRNKFLEDSRVSTFKPVQKVGDSEKALSRGSSGIGREEREAEATSGVVIKNANHVIVYSDSPGFESFGKTYVFKASSGIKKKGKGLGNAIRIYNFTIEGDGELISPSYDNSLEFRRVANAFVELYSLHAIGVRETEVYDYLYEFSLQVDSDMDGVLDSADAFPNDASETRDSDGDGVGDNADAFPNDPTETVDSDGDGTGDNADAFPNDASETRDSDGDGVGDNADAFPNDPTETVDTDGDGTGDNADTDDDNDTYSDQDEIDAGTDPKDSESYPEPSETTPQGRQTNELTENLVGFYTTNETASYAGSGTTMNDSINSEAPAATLRNSVLYVNDDTTVNVPYLQFDGVDDHIRFPHREELKIPVGSSRSVRNVGMTLSMWIKPNLDGSSGGIFCNDAHGQAYYYGMTFGIMSSGGIYWNELNQGHPQRKGRYNRETTIWNAINGKYPFTDASNNGEWIHVVLVAADFGEGRHKSLYINGQLWDAVAAHSGEAGRYRSYIDYTSNLGGAIGNTLNSTAYYNGGFESMKVFRGALTETQIQQEYNARKGLFNHE